VRQSTARCTGGASMNSEKGWSMTMSGADSGENWYYCICSARCLRQPPKGTLSV
jgi:hypothetical protein